MATIELLSTKQVAAELGITQSLVRRYIRAGTLPRIQIGERSYAINRTDLERFKAQRARRRRAS